MNTALEVLRQELGHLRRAFGVKRIGVFGSCAHAAAGPDSDVDILVEFDQPTFDHYMDLKFHLERVYGRRVDLVTPLALKPRIKSQILREVQYAA